MSQFGHQEDKQPPNFDSTSAMGKRMWVIAWLIGLGLLTLFFGNWSERQHNPNQSPDSVSTNGYTEVVLQRNRYGHYVTSGTINGQPVTFLLDTGATTVAVPSPVANQLRLQRGVEYQTQTANGYGTAYQTTIDELSIGGIEFRQLRGGILTNMPGEEILLGMSALKQIEFTQRGNQLILRQYH